MTGSPSGASLPEKAADTSVEQPWPVRVLSLKIADYVDKMSPLWVEGQVVQINRRGTTAYLVLRDPDVDMSLSASISVHAAHLPHGVAVMPVSQFNALAMMRASVVLPTPRVPVKR